MCKLIRAEVYRLFRSRGYVRVMLLTALVMAFMPFFVDFSLLAKNLAENMESFLLTGSMLIMYVPFVSVFFVTAGYMKKTAYYEVMAGNKTAHIIGSKLLVDGVGIGVIVFVLAIGLEAVVVIKNGTGGVIDLPGRTFLFFVICLHVTLLTVLVGMAVKHFAAAAVLFLRIQLLDMMPAALLPMLAEKLNLSKETSERILRCTFSQQLMDVFRADITAEFVIITVASLVVEVVFWYGIVYVTMKKRWYR